jgi:hypothetical protein
MKQTARKKDPNRYPKGWNRARVQAVLDHYGNQTEDEAVAEDEAALRSKQSSMIEVPLKPVPIVTKLIAKHEALRDRGASASRRRRPG